MITGANVLKDFAKVLYLFQRIPIDGKTKISKD